MRHLPMLSFLLWLLLSCDGGRHDRMLQVLAEADSMNRHYVSFTSDSLLADATRYFDSHGTPNERLRSHYLLGCAYRDMGQAPQALQCYQDAADCADTTAADCDYQRLMAVYGQMAELFHAQNLPEDELAVRHAYNRYALQEKDTFKFIKNVELLSRPYFLLGDTAKLLRALKYAKGLYLKHGYMKEASSMNIPLVHYSITSGSIDTAHRLMCEFETLSGLLRKDGTVSYNLFAYYYQKGELMMAEGKTDSAELFFRKLLPFEDYENAYRGLLSVYQKRRDIDSISKYAFLYEGAVDTLHNRMRTDVVHRMSSMYNYQRFQLKSERDEKVAKNARLTTFFMVFLSMAILLWGWDFYKKRLKKEKEHALHQAEIYNKLSNAHAKLKAELAVLEIDNENMRQACCDLQAIKECNTVLENRLNRLNDELSSMSKEKELVIKQKQLELEELSAKLREQHNLMSKVSISAQVLALCDSDVVRLFHSKGKKRANSVLPNHTEWKGLQEHFAANLPLVYAAIGKDAVLSSQEMHVFMLQYLDFTNNEMLVLLDTTPQNISNIKSRINKKLFDKDSSSSLNVNLKTKLLPL